MKYMITWNERPQGTPIEYEKAQKRILEVFSPWKAPTNFKIESFVIQLLLDGTGTAYKTGYLLFQLQNCGANVPNVTAGNFIVQGSFDLRPSGLNGRASTKAIFSKQAH